MDEKNITSFNQHAWKRAIITLDASIEQAIIALNGAGVKLLMILDEHGRLKGTVSDGDIRSGLLKGLGMTSSVAEVLHNDAVVVFQDAPREDVLKLMIANKIQQIPIVDRELRVIGLHIWNEITIPPLRSNLMIIMAGGKGTRLRPFTDNCPKPMVNVAGKPMLEHIIERARFEGFRNFVLSIHYFGHMIEEYFGNGSRFDVNIEYLREKNPLGTAGALSLLQQPPFEPFVVTNGDVVTNIRYGDLLDFHVRYDAAATMAVLTHEWQHPYGVVQTKDIEIIGFEEKPIVRTHINAGVYALSPDTLRDLSSNQRCDMPTLFERLQARSQRTIVYPMHEPWLDVGRPDDLEKANRTMVASNEGVK